MKRILLFAIAALGTSATFGQTVFSSNFETWSGGAPAGWNGSKSNIGLSNVIQESATPHQGQYSVGLVNCATSHKRFSTQPIAVTEGQVYQVKYFVKGQGDIRVGLFDNDLSNTDFGYTYGSYQTINSNTYTQYTANITADTTYSNAEFLFSVKNTCTGTALTIDSVVISLTTAPTVSIYDIQYNTNTNGSSNYNGQTVVTGGIVTAKYTGFNASDSTGYFIQSGTGAWRGINVYDRNNSVQIGDSVAFTAKVVETFSNTDLTNVTNFTKVTGQTPPAPVTITTAAVNAEQYEGVLVKVLNAEAKRKTNFGEWVVTNGGAGDTTMVDDKAYYFVPTIGTRYDVTGVVFYSYNRFRIEPRMASDIAISTGVREAVAREISVYPNPVTAGEPVRIEGLASGSLVQVLDVTGKVILSDIHTSNGNYTMPSKLRSGLYFIQVTNESVKSVSRLIVQ